MLGFETEAEDAIFEGVAVEIDLRCFTGNLYGECNNRVAVRCIQSKTRGMVIDETARQLTDFSSDRSAQTI